MAAIDACKPIANDVEKISRQLSTSFRGGVPPVMANTSLSRVSVTQLYNTIHLIPKVWSEHGVEALWTGQKKIILSCPQCLDSMLAPGFWNKVYTLQYNTIQYNAIKHSLVKSLSHYRVWKKRMSCVWKFIKTFSYAQHALEKTKTVSIFTVLNLWIAYE